MLIDANQTLEFQDYDADVVIIGSGIVGMTIARELPFSTKVILIEGGDKEGDGSLFNESINCGLNYPIEETRALKVGGSSTIWAGYCGLFDKDDFCERDWVPNSGWPIGQEDLEPYYPETAKILGIKDFSFNPAYLRKRSNTHFPLNPDKFEHGIWRFGEPTLRVGVDWLSWFEDHSSRTLIYNAKVHNIMLDDTLSRADRVEFLSNAGGRGIVTAQTFVVAAGGLETARLLLNSNRQIKTGLGNEYGNVGRYFMEHPHFTLEGIHLTDYSRFQNSWTERESYGDGHEFMSSFGLSLQLREKLEILNFRAHVFRTPDMTTDAAPRIGIFMEQSPNLDSHVYLAEDKDERGIQKLILEWSLSDLEWQSYHKIRSFIGRDIESEGIGHYDDSIDSETRNYDLVLHSNHHLGTTRMASSKINGVVDKNCKTFAYDNLFIVGGSVFPTVSWANPTFTLLALALRFSSNFTKTT